MGARKKKKNKKKIIYKIVEFEPQKKKKDSK